MRFTLQPVLYSRLLQPFVTLTRRLGLSVDLLNSFDRLWRTNSRTLNISCLCCVLPPHLPPTRRLNYFCHDTTSGLEAVVSAAEADGRVAGYVLDLRNNPGGVFEEAVAISALFEVGAGVVAAWAYTHAVG